MTQGQQSRTRSHKGSVTAEKTENELQLEKAIRVWRQNPTPDNGRILKLMQGRVKREKAKARKQAREV